MKNTFALIFFLFIGIYQAQAQSYNSSLGVRLGTDWGVTAMQRVYKNLTAELIIQSSLQREEGMVTLLAQQHQPMVIRNLNIYYGGGFHAGWLDEVAPEGEDPYKNPFGIDGMVGLELSIRDIHLTYDFKPAINLSGGTKTIYTQTGVSIRYKLWKREKYQWEKTKKRRERERRRKDRRKEREKNKN